MSKSKTFSSEISQRYALALYDLSKENNQIKEFETNMTTFMRLFNSNEHLKYFIKNPTHSIEDQKTIFDRILSSMNFNKIVKNFFFILIIKKRIFFVDKIIDEFLSLISKKKGEISANLISATKLNEKTISDIDSNIKLKHKMDSSLIGGVVIQIGSLMIDTSIKNRLQKYKKLMTEA